MPELIFQHSEGFVLIEEDVVDTLHRWRQFGLSSEAGGLLLGYRRTPHLHIISCTTPNQKDRRFRYSFARLDNNHSAFATQLWKKTNGKAYYLGEWHTHPVNSPTPSGIDRHEWTKLIQSTHGPELVFLIIGRKGIFAQVGQQMLNEYKQ